MTWFAKEGPDATVGAVAVVLILLNMKTDLVAMPGGLWMLGLSLLLGRSRVHGG